ncbi:hypothetical protein [Flavobacterium nitratireducens]|uniref:hypothetical protein n=1 Tax=Flavobacterium nitratireducens TaxID=992289 RepID=UPI00241530B9|nr:hypothetical protein [Flavobacterium nitratireducens]
MKNEVIKTKCGHELKINGIQIKETYGDILVGEPELEDNLRIYDGLDVPSNWFVRKCVYSMKSFDLDKKYFLPYTVHVWVSSHKSVNDPKKKFYGSELVIIGTIDSIINFSVQELIEDVIKDFDWEKYAINFKI